MIDNNNLKLIFKQLNSWCETNSQVVKSVYDECKGMSLQELVYYLFGVVKEYSEKVVESVDKYNELYTFVKKFFDNLDLQTEVNNKIDDMFNNGYFNDIIKSNMIVNQFSNKNVVFIGDSTVYGDNTTGGQTEVTLPSAFQKMTGCQSFNYGNNGLSVCGTSGNTLYSKISSIDLSKADYVILLCGYNDWNKCNPVGKLLKTNTYGKFSDALYNNIKAIANKCKPNTKIYMCTMLPSGQSVTNTPNSYGVLIETYIDAILRVCYDINIPVINLFKSVPINSFNYEELLYDMTHPKSETYTMIAEAMVYSMGSGECWNNSVSNNYSLIGTFDFNSVMNDYNNNSNSFTFKGSVQSFQSRTLYNIRKGVYTIGITIYNSDTSAHTFEIKLNNEKVYSAKVLNGINYIEHVIRINKDYYNSTLTILISDMTVKTPDIYGADLYLLKGKSLDFDNKKFNVTTGSMLGGEGSVKIRYIDTFAEVEIDFVTREDIVKGKKISNILSGSMTGFANNLLQAIDLDTNEIYILKLNNTGIVSNSAISNGRHIVCKQMLLI